MMKYFRPRLSQTMRVRNLDRLQILTTRTKNTCRQDDGNKQRWESTRPPLLPLSSSSSPTPCHVITGSPTVLLLASLRPDCFENPLLKENFHTGIGLRREQERSPTLAASLSLIEFGLQVPSRREPSPLSPSRALSRTFCLCNLYFSITEANIR